MKKIFVFVFLLLALACNNGEDHPDVSGVEVSLATQRFDQDFFSLDTLQLETGLLTLEKKYPTLLPLFLQTIVGVQDATGTRDFYRLYKPVFDSSQKLYKDFGAVEKQVVEGFQFAKHYFPSHKFPASLIPVVGPMNSRQDLAQMANGDYTPNFLGPDFLGISLQFYLGKEFSLYQHEYFITNVAPLYLSRRFSKEYIVADVMKLIADDIYTDKSKGRPLIEQMIERGKQWWLVDKFLPNTADSIKTGYTQQQLEWCEENEGLIWSYLVRNEDINSINPITLQTYIGESPFTAVFSQELSPGNIGQWIGWRIVEKFAASRTSGQLNEILQTPARKILEDAKYKPK